MDIRTVDEIDRDLAAYTLRRRDTLDRLVVSMMVLNAIDHRVQILLEHRHTASAAG